MAVCAVEGSLVDEDARKQRLGDGQHNGAHAQQRAQTHSAEIYPGSWLYSGSAVFALASFPRRPHPVVSSSVYTAIPWNASTLLFFRMQDLQLLSGVQFLRQAEIPVRALIALRLNTHFAPHA